MSDRLPDRWQLCEIPECRNEVPRAKGICDECMGVGSE